jgi:hypothetical protein
MHIPRRRMLEDNSGNPDLGKERRMTIHIGIGAVSLVAGILILVAPKLLNYIVAFYLIAFGILTLLGR